MDGRTIITWFLTGAFVLFIVVYSTFTLYGYFLGPRIISLTPESGISTRTPVVVVEGTAVHINALAINGTETPTDLNGHFGSQLILAEGYNIIKVTAKDRYDRTVEKTIEITLLPQVIATSTKQEATTTKSTL